MHFIKKATLDDLSFLQILEQQSFASYRQFDKSALKRAILSPNQLVYLIYVDENVAGAAIIHSHKRAWRLYSIALLPTFRGQKLGLALMNFIIEEAKSSFIERIVLEADYNNATLISFYEKLGFKKIGQLRDYYKEEEDALKMELVLNPNANKLVNLVVTDLNLEWLSLIPNIEVVTPEQYINAKRFTYGEFRIFNLCSSYKYQTKGYYVSLFAQARQQRAIPNFTTLEDFVTPEIITSISEEGDDIINNALKKVNEKEFRLKVIWGQTNEETFAPLAATLYNLFKAPFLEFTFVKDKRWFVSQVKPLGAEEVEINEEFTNNALKYFAQKKFMTSTFKNYKYDLAILVDEEEVAPPSNRTALRKFKQAAEKIGLYTEFITKDDYHRIKQFDALFIRATTNPNNYTYDFSRLAYAEGLIVIDDPFSILKCANKVFLHEAMNIHNIRAPKTRYVTKDTDLAHIQSEFSFPLILKQPDSASSLGVFKVENEMSLKEKLDKLFTTSEIIIAQEFLKSDFDWRVGILNNKVLFVCQYFMAKNHWQIYNWNAKKKFDTTGNVTTFLPSEAPGKVVETALAASSVIGDGFYGVDLKEVNNKLYVIEVNDNPSIDYNVEDLKLKDELYALIVGDIFRRIEEARNSKRRESVPPIN